jgi:hypothetical protein
VTTDRNGCHAFGLAIDLLDGIACDGLAPCHGSGRLPPTEVRLAANGQIDDSWREDLALTTRELRVRGELIFSVAHLGGVGYLLTMPEFGRFLVGEDGVGVACEPTVAEWTAALRVQVLPLAATLRGLEPFHASAVAVDERALMVCAPVLGGKSSLAAHLVDTGASLVSDDVVAVDVAEEVIRAHPGGCWLQLRPPEDERIAAAGSGRLQPAGAEDGRPRYEAPLAPGPTRLGAVYLIEPGGDDAPAISPALGSGLALLSATYNLSVREPARLRRQLELVHRITDEVGVFRLAVSRAFDARHHALLVREHFESEVGAGRRA